jgi:drug/metabolite transporter (DMT)-like permease
VSAAAEAAGQRRRGQAYVALAALAWSTAGLLQRELRVDTATQVAARAFFALLALLAWIAISERGRVVAAFRETGRAGVAVAFCLALASGTFIVALNRTTVAQVLFMQAVAPLAAALLGALLLSEPIPRRTWLAIAIALAGVAVMVGGPAGGGAAADVLTLVMAVSFALSIVITRSRRDVSMLPATCLAQLFVLLAAAPFASPGTIGGRDAALLVLLGAGQMALGLAFLVVGARLIPAAEVVIITLLEIVLGPLWVWLALSETPSRTTLAGGVIVVTAVVIQASGELGRGGGSGAARAP